MHPATESRDLRFGNIRRHTPGIQTGQGLGLFSKGFVYALVVSDLPSVSVPEEGRALDSLVDAR